MPVKKGKLINKHTQQVTPAPALPASLNSGISKIVAKLSSELLQGLKNTPEPRKEIWIVTDPEQDHYCHSEAEAINHILNNYSLTQAQKVTLFKVIPFRMKAQVVTGQDL